MLDRAQSMMRVEAAKALGISVGTSREEARAAFLKRLAECDFTPPDLWREAAAELSLIEGKSRENLRRSAEPVIRDQVEKFASDQYWSLPPDRRTARWKELRNCSVDYPRLLSRLNDLEYALNIKTPAKPSNEFETDILQAILNHYCLPLTGRLERQNYLKEEMNYPTFQEAAKAVAERYPDLIKVDRLAKTNLLPPNESVRNKKYNPRKAKREYRASYHPTRTSKGYWWAFVCLFLVINGIRLVAKMNSTPERITPPARTEAIDRIKNYERLMGPKMKELEERLRKNRSSQQPVDPNK